MSLASSKATRWLLGLFFAAQVVAVSLLEYGYHNAAQLECNTVSYPAEVLGCGSLRIAFLADVHNNVVLFRQAIEKIEEAKPDLIVFGGDFIMTDQRFMRTRWAVDGLRRLQKTAPVYAVLGNQDYEMLPQVERVFRTAGVMLLRNTGADFTTPDGSVLHIAGLGDWNEGDEAPERCLQPAGQGEKPVLLLSHDPESRWLLRGYNWQLMLSGHTHGGQLGIPFAHKYLSFRSSMPAGAFDFEGNRRVFVTRGIGAIYGARFFCPPEINIIDIGR